MAFAQIADGDGWTTKIAFFNTTASAGSAVLNCHEDTGQGDNSTKPWTVTFVDGSTSSQTFAVPGGGAVFLSTPGTATNLTAGFCTATVSPGVQGSGEFLAAGVGLGTDPFITSGNHYVVTYDNTAGSGTSFAIANPTNQAEDVSVTFMTVGGQIITPAPIHLVAGAHAAFQVSAMFAATAGTEGLMEISTSGTALALTALQDEAQFFTSANVTSLNGQPLIIRFPRGDQGECYPFPTEPPCSAPWILVETFDAAVPSGTLHVTLTPAQGGLYTAQISGSTSTGVSVSGSFLGGVVANPANPSTFAFTQVAPASTFATTGSSLTFTLMPTALNASTNIGVGTVTGTILLNQANGPSTIIGGSFSGAFTANAASPLTGTQASTLTFSLQSRSPGTGNLAMSVQNTGAVAVTHVTITSITGITASGGTFVYTPGLLNPPFAVPGAANLAPGATSGFNLTFQPTSGNPGAALSFVITATADNVAPFTTTINVPPSAGVP